MRDAAGFWGAGHVVAGRILHIEDTLGHNSNVPAEDLATERAAQ